MNEKELFYETVMSLKKLESHNKYYIAGVVKGMLAVAQLRTNKEENTKETS
ncbi:hypothetical protein [Bacillus mycoides]|uniref:hypothetical protein n=1 Tax=Bacillus mycoides TaxID=1405 RepID=UPI00211224C9|nr:hypothetical protein [Bacillus mycoides]MCQ6528995.1 hypothetical protein [Bacillus mycoides]